jgi:uncharacterized coiled-coil protein SlyX
MRTSLLSRWVRIIGLALALAFAAAGCSVVRVAYNQAPDMVYWWADGYVDFNEAQAPRARDAIAAWFRWHRSTQLRDYADLLARAHTLVAGSVTPAVVCRWWDDLRERYDLALERAVPSAAELVVTLTPEQLKHMERRYAKGLDEMRADFLRGDLAERQRAALKRTVDRFETLYGRIDDEQRRQIAAGLAASPFDAERWIAERAARQRDTIATLSEVIAQRASPEAAQAALRALAERAERSPRLAYRDYTKRLTEYNCAFVARIHNLTTPAQREAAQAKLAGWEADLRALAANGQ